MATVATTRRQRAASSSAVQQKVKPTFASSTVSHRTPTFVQSPCRTYHLAFATKCARTKRSADRHSQILMVAAPPSSVDSPRPASRFLQPVPEAKPHEILPPRRGRNSRRRTKEAEHFRKYIYLRRQLKPWSDQFRAKHGRTPSLIDVHDSDIPGLMDRFVEYLDALEGLRLDV